MSFKSTTYIRDELRNYSIDDLWKIIEKLLPCEEVPNKAAMNRDQVLELCIMLEETDEMFRMLEQIALLKKAIDDLEASRS